MAVTVAHVSYGSVFIEVTESYRDVDVVMAVARILYGCVVCL